MELICSGDGDIPLLCPLTGVRRYYLTPVKGRMKMGDGNQSDIASVCSSNKIVQKNF